MQYKRNIPELTKCIIKDGKEIKNLSRQLNYSIGEFNVFTYIMFI